DLGTRGADALLDLACASMGFAERCVAVDAESEVRDEALVGVEEAKLARRRAGLVADDAHHEIVLVGDVLRFAGRSLRVSPARLEMRLDGDDLGHLVADRALDLFGNRVRLVEGQLGRELEVEGELRAGREGDGADVVHLAHARHAERRGVRALAYGTGELA